ncbi:unnamed protein product [Protopolystoma xenopodis]|uniref:Uncharacterized protein n=1 Tax=Protopolystoma xenopodis TaxID=117903 RepID=A0A448XGG3_9PLAT|nr:unnamed protein product [Protopolystoma xenopodis]
MRPGNCRMTRSSGRPDDAMLTLSNGLLRVSVKSVCSFEARFPDATPRMALACLEAADAPRRQFEPHNPRPTDRPEDAIHLYEAAVAEAYL